jgi:Cation/multidrug efflux pump
MKTEWMRTELPPTDNVKAVLRSAIMEYACNKSNNERKTSQYTSHSNVQVESANQFGSQIIATPPPIVRAQYVANVRTSASELSSITHSTYSQSDEHFVLGTRSSYFSDSDSDEDDDFEWLNGSFYVIHTRILQYTFL